MQPDRDPVYDRIEVSTLTSTVTPVEPTNAPEHLLCTNADLVGTAFSPEDCKTPEHMRKMWVYGQTQAFGEDVNRIPKIRVRQGYRPWNSTAHLELHPDTVTNPLDANGLHLKFWVACNPAYMCRPRDLVPIYLGSGERPQLFMVILLEPAWHTNYYEVEVHYTLEQAAKLLLVRPRSGEDLRTAITKRYRELGLRAQWLGFSGQKPPLPNGPVHQSGGVEQKNGSGKIRLVPYTLDELERSEKTRNTSWNMAEQMTSNRPVFNEFKTILQPYKQMMTSLEAESEYLLDSEEELRHIVTALTEVCKDERRWKDLGITKMSGEEKDYIDSYFDLDGLPLLQNRIVLRRREVPKRDPEGTFLFSVKGGTYSHQRQPRERLRLGAQVELIPEALETEQGRAELRRFLTTTMCDNPIARTLQAALMSQPDVFERLAKEDTQVVLKVASRRYTFQMSLRDGTIIDFSGDIATASHAGQTCQVFSFEFGVGHPALTAATTGTTTGRATGKRGAFVQQMSEQTESGPSIVRPYHVPRDLTNMMVFGKSEYQQFKALRDRVIREVFALDLNTLIPGGNKATELAKKLGMLK